MDSIALFANAFGALRLVAIVVAVVLVATRATGRRRVLGVIGLLIMVFGVIVGYGMNALLPMLSNAFDLVYSTMYPVVLVVNAVIDLAAIFVIVAALCVRDQPAPMPYPR